MTISFARKALLGTAIAAPWASVTPIGAQPHMNEKRHPLAVARGELAAATPNQGRPSRASLGLIDQAISEVRGRYRVRRRLIFLVDDPKSSPIGDYS